MKYYILQPAAALTKYPHSAGKIPVTGSQGLLENLF